MAGVGLNAQELCKQQALTLLYKR